MPTAKRAASQLDHRVQVARARRHLQAARAGAAGELAAVARTAGASKFHLARLHRAITGETVGHARTRLRVEAAAAALVADPRRPITAIALAVGYATPSALNKAFRAALGLAPTAFRRASPATRAARLARLAPRRTPGAYALSPPEVRRARDWRVACVDERGPYAEVAAPLAWAELERRLAVHPLAGARMAASYGNPRRAPPDELRYQAGVVLGPGERPPPGLRAATWPGGAFAVFEMRGDVACIEAAFAALAADWHRFGWTDRAGPCLEHYLADPARTPPADMRTELWIPIVDPEA